MDGKQYTFTSSTDDLTDNFYLRNAGENTACLVWLHGHGSHGDQPFTRKDVVKLLHPMAEMYDLSLFSPNLRDNAWMSKAAVADLREMLLYLKKQYKFSRFLFLCGSMGGTGGLIFAVKHPELVDGLGIMGAATDIARYREYCRTRDVKIVQEIFQAISDNYSPEDFEDHNVCRQFEKLSMPLCFYHGMEDKVMPVSEMLELQKRMKDFPKAEFKIVPGTHDAPLAFMQEIFEKISGLKDFRSINSREHASAPDGGPMSGNMPGYNLFLFHQGEYWRRADESVSVYINNARSIEYALDRLPLDFPEDQMFFGGLEQFFVPELPPEISLEDYERNLLLCKEKCLRNFAAGWSHTAPDFSTLMREGIGGFIARAEQAYKKHRTDESLAMLISLQALAKFFRRAAEFWRSGRPEAAELLRRNAELPPGSFAEALQLTWLVFVVLTAQNRWHNALARMDQYLYESFKKEGIDHTAALNMLCHIFCKVEGVHKIVNICIGGMRSDGSDACNELSFLILKATELVRSASTNLSARLNRNTPDDFLRACIKLIATGIGFPALMNDHVYIGALQRCGIPLEAARDYALFGCVEGNIPGRAPAWSDSRFNLAEQFAAVLEKLEHFESYDELFQAFADKVREEMVVNVKKFDDNFRRFPADRFPDPLLSALTGSCIARGKDINAGGADFPRQHGIGMVGPATVCDSLAAVKKLVFEEKRITPKELLDALHNDFRDAEILRQTLVNCAPKFGNDDPYVDSIFADIVKLCGETAESLRSRDGGYIKSLMASNVQNISCGKTVPATPDGRFAGTALSDAASPSGGMDRSGPTAFMNSITLPDYSAQNCSVVNMRFLPDMFADAGGFERMLALVKKFIDSEGHEIQFNVTDNETLRDAMENPEKYGDFIVRVSGFSAFFTKLPREIQLDIIRRNAHGR